MLITDRVLFFQCYLSEEEFKQFGSEAVAKLGLKNHHLISYDLKDHKYSDLGEITFEDGSEPVHINSLAYGADGNFYAVTTIELQVGNIASDLISFPNPNVTQ